MTFLARPRQNLGARDKPEPTRRGRVAFKDGHVRCRLRSVPTASQPPGAAGRVPGRCTRAASCAEHSLKNSAPAPRKFEFASRSRHPRAFRPRSNAASTQGEHVRRARPRCKWTWLHRIPADASNASGLVGPATATVGVAVLVHAYLLGAPASGSVACAVGALVGARAVRPVRVPGAVASRTNAQGWLSSRCHRSWGPEYDNNRLRWSTNHRCTRCRHCSQPEGSLSCTNSCRPNKRRWCRRCRHCR